MNGMRSECFDLLRIVGILDIPLFLNRNRSSQDGPKIMHLYAHFLKDISEKVRSAHFLKTSTSKPVQYVIIILRRPTEKTMMSFMKSIFFTKVSLSVGPDCMQNALLVIVSRERDLSAANILTKITCEHKLER